MTLDQLHQQISEAISSLDCERIWPDFKPLRFALYNEEKCFFDGNYIEKTDDFCANTSIVFREEQIAIWKVEGEPNVPVLTSKIVHEMFHGYQMQQKWDCWADEMEALYRYQYRTENLSLKLRENELLLSILDHFDPAAYQELLSHRKLRSIRYPYEFSYETKVEEIEGTANYIEWMVLTQLDKQQAATMVTHMRTIMTQPEYLCPIRISSYFTGALMTYAMIRAGDYTFTPVERPAIHYVMKMTQTSDGSFTEKENCCQKVSSAIAAFHKVSEAAIQAALARNDVVINGPLELLGVNIYDARFYRGYVTSRYFLQYQDVSGPHTLSGNYIVKMADERTIACVYSWDGVLSQ